MKTNLLRTASLGTAVVAAAFLASCSVLPGGAPMHGQTVTLTGSQQVPPVTTNGTGSAGITVGSDCSVRGNISVSGFTATAAHIHQGARGANGPVIVPFTKTADNTFASPEGAKLNENQCAAYRAGNTYVNVHSAQNPGGEIRAQLQGR
jgi:hypothetical protein